jgi:uncharacterized caspase-like protein
MHLALQEAARRSSRSRTQRLLSAAVALAASTLAFIAPARAERRVALVIGNAAYASLPALDKPANDATDIKQALEALGFEVRLGVDLDFRHMSALVGEFAAEARKADVSLFYYSGHGFQLGGANVLAPVDFRGPESLKAGTIAVQDVLASLEGGAGAAGADRGPIHLIFLDACRNNPLKGKPGAEQQALRDGLAPVPKRPNFLMAYATLPDAYSYEGDAGRNSFYAKAFLTHVGTPGQPLEKFMLKVRSEVFRQTGGAQSPVDESALLREFAFAKGEEDLASLETQLWQYAAATNSPSLMDAYLRRYPAGPHAAAAREGIKVASLSGPSAGASLSRSLVAGEDDKLWTLASRMRDRALAKEYLRRFPNGSHAMAAHHLLNGAPDGAEDTPGAVCARLATHDRDGTEAVRGVPWDLLVDHAQAAVTACEAAVARWPDDPVYKTHLARALSAAGRQPEAIALFEAAARAGNARAMVSIGLALKQGTVLPKDEQAALAWFEKAAAVGFEDGVISLTNILLTDPRRRDRARAIELLRKAADLGSAKSTFNLAVLANDDKRFAEAATLFEQAGDLGYGEGYPIAAAFFDSAKMPRIRDPERAAKLILKAAAADDGTFVLKFAMKSYTAETMARLGAQLRAMGHLAGARPTEAAVKEALRKWSAYGVNVKTASR